MTRLAAVVRALWGVAAGVALMLTPRSADAFCRTRTCSGGACGRDSQGCATQGAPLQWPSSCVGFALNPAGISDIPDEDLLREIVERSFSAWSDVRCNDGRVSLQFIPRADTACAAPRATKGGPNANIVFFRENDWRYKGIDGTLATTTVSFDTETGEIYDADIAINTANNSFSDRDNPASDEYNLELVLSHEVGHFIGIAHSDEGDALMSPNASPGERFRTLTADDRAAACAAYPSRRGATCQREPEGGWETSCSAEEAGGCAMTSSATGADLAQASVFIVLVAYARSARRRRSARHGHVCRA